MFLGFAVGRHGGWEAVLERVAAVRPDGLREMPPTASVGLLTMLILVAQGFFFAGSPTAGEGMTAQRFMAARNERHAVGGQIFNAFLALTLRTLPLIGLGVVATNAAFVGAWTRVWLGTGLVLGGGGWLLVRMRSMGLQQAAAPARSGDPTPGGRPERT